MSNDPYAAPSAELENTVDVIPTSIWSARGRLGVLSYFAQGTLLTLAFTILALLVVFLLGGAAAGGDPEAMLRNLESGSVSPMLLLAFLPLLLVFLYIGACQLIKRLHDRNHSGWWSIPVFILMIIPILGLLVGLYVFLAPGNKSGNRFGGQRMTRGWEKVVGIIGLGLFILSIVFTLYGLISGGASLMTG